MPKTRIGISGWRYPPWRNGAFYPKGLPQRRELEYASSKFNSVEINGSFYSLQHLSSWQQWYDQTPANFNFAIKGGRFITHMKKLRDVRVPLANFFAQGLLLLKEKLGPILWQLPPILRFDTRDPSRFEDFFAMLPRDTRAAGALAKEHGPKLDGRAYTEARVNLPLRYAVEVRHDSFMCPPFVEMLRRHNVSLCLADTAGIFPYTEDMTADFVYVRLHGAEQLYWSGYRDEQLSWWAARIAQWREGREPPDARHVHPKSQKLRSKARDIYVYFDNDAKVHAPWDAINLIAKTAAHPTVGENMRSANAMGAKRPRVARRQIQPLRTEWPDVRRAREKKVKSRKSKVQS
jgi:uncharacterized protein YecE (DUF72 family)